MVSFKNTRQVSIPRAGGLYILLLKVDEPAQLVIGQLGTFRFEVGDYAYVGSAYGPGGLSARLQRHMRLPNEKRQHWHIDYLTSIAEVRAIGWSSESLLGECEWSAALARDGRRWPPRFGASDCRCAGHLVEFHSQIHIPELNELMPEQLHLRQL